MLSHVFSVCFFRNVRNYCRLSVYNKTNNRSVVDQIAFDETRAFSYERENVVSPDKVSTRSLVDIRSNHTSSSGHFDHTALRLGSMSPSPVIAYHPVGLGQNTKPFYFFLSSLISTRPTIFGFRTSNNVSSAFWFLIIITGVARRDDVEVRVTRPGQCVKIIHRYVVVLCKAFIARRPEVRTMIERSTPDIAVRVACVKRHETRRF